MLSPTHDDALRHLERLGDRLRVVGPRLAAREGQEAQDLLAEIRAGLQQLADLAADADGRSRRPMPELAAFALADQLMVLGYDLLGRPSDESTSRPSLDLDPAGQRSDAFRAVAMNAIGSIHRLV